MWKHWWGYLPDGTSSETDIFAVFESDDGQRFALHIENKPPHGKIDLRQAADYRRRAIHWARKEQYLSYGEFETILMAPATFIQANTACARQFDMTLSYEDLAAWIPFFAINGDRNAVTARCAPHAARRTRDDEGIVAEHDTSKRYDEAVEGLRDAESYVARLAPKPDTPTTDHHLKQWEGAKHLPQSASPSSSSCRPRMGTRGHCATTSYRCSPGVLHPRPPCTAGCGNCMETHRMSAARNSPRPCRLAKARIRFVPTSGAYVPSSEPS